MKNKRKVLKIVKRKNYTIIFSEQENLEDDLTGLYRVIAELLYEDALKNNDR
ncbi:hypothetical protein [Metabacillus litoralis]|uniref:hypothetical protein n=1 Tax=Metabacillus litoralis TaxID=152268 RepID=UPI00203B4FFE|nr:hypothetical protein [Metabacillus litoralis]MCM3160967.1 hypothetical protein [Metabacillus litoralis]